MTASSRIAGDGNEVGHEVERHDEVGDERGKNELPAPRDAAVGEEAPEEDDKVRDQAGYRTCLLLPPGDDQPDDEERVGEERRPQADQDPCHTSTLSQGYGRRGSPRPGAGS